MTVTAILRNAWGRRQTTLRGELICLVLAASLPLVAFAALTIWRLVDAEQRGVEQRLEAQSRALANAVDRELDRHLAALDALASSPHLRSGDLEAFQRQSRDGFSIRDAWIMLIDSAGRQLVNTLQPFGAALPDADLFASIFADARPQVSGLALGPLLGEPLVAVGVPVMVDGHVAYVLAAGLLPARLLDIMHEQNLPPDWLASIVDRAGAIVARTRDQAKYVGQPATASYRALLAGAGEGRIDTVDKDGTEMHGAIARSRLAGWMIGVGVPVASYGAPIRHSLGQVGLGAAVLLLPGLLLSFMLGRRIAGELSALAQVARMLAARRAPPPARLSIAELAALQRTLRDVGGRLLLADEERDAREGELRATNTRLAELTHALDLAPAMIRDVDGTIRVWSAGARRLYGWTAAEAVGRNAHVLLETRFPEPPDAIAAALLDEGHWQGELRHRCADGREIAVASAWALRRDGDARPAAVIEVNNDITARKDAEARLQCLAESLEERVAERTRALEAEAARRESAQEQLRQAQKMEAVGQLTGGIAHDFNNVLTVIAGNLDLLQGRLAGQPGLHALASAATAAADRAEKLTAQLLAFSRRQRLEPVPLDLDEVLRGIESLLRRSAGERVAVRWERAARPVRALADRNQLEAAVLNLVINARDAVLEKGGGSVAIAAGEARLAAGDPALPPELAPGLFAMLTIADDGAGMAPEVRAKVFEPFFTTKETGKGSGLGLSQVYGFVRQSGGHVTIASEPGRGTVVTLYLPESGAAAAAAPVDAPAAGEAAALRRGAVVLVAEDEDDVREFAAAVLSGRGVEVLEASTGEGALELLARRPDVDLVFSDVVMPGRSGVELAAHVLAELPGIAVVLTSGYTKELAEGADLPGSVRFLPKPYRAGELCAAIDAALAERHAAA